METGREKRGCGEGRGIDKIEKVRKIERVYGFSTNCLIHLLPGTMTVEEIYQDRQKFSQAVYDVASQVKSETYSNVCAF